MSALLSLLAFVLADNRRTVGIARADDWSYLNETFHWAESGTLELNGWVHMMFVVQGAAGALVVKIFGANAYVLQILVLSMGAVGLLVVFWLSRRVLSSGFSFFVVAVVGLSPLWLHLSISFMTDVPAWTLSVLSIAIGVHAVTILSRRWLTLGAAVGLLAFGIREYSLLPLIALLIWVLLSGSAKPFKRWALTLMIVVTVIGGISYGLRQWLPGSIQTVPSAPYESLTRFSSLLLTLSLLVAPFLALAVVLLWPRRGELIDIVRTHWVGALLGLVAGIGIAYVSSLQLLGNVIHPYGSSWTSAGDGVRLLPFWVFRMLTLVGVASLFVIFTVIGVMAQERLQPRRRSSLEQTQAASRTPFLYLFIALAIVAGYFVAIFILGAPAFDRYLMLVVPLLGIVILWLATQRMNEPTKMAQKIAASVTLAVTGAAGLLITDGLNQVDGLRWQVASDLVVSGIPAYKIDGGDSWFRYHQKDAPYVAQIGSLENSIPGRTWWQTFFEGSTFCRMIAIESETDLQAMYGPALSIQEERTIFGTPFRVMVFPGPDPC